MGIQTESLIWQTDIEPIIDFRQGRISQTHHIMLVHQFISILVYIAHISGTKFTVSLRYARTVYFVPWIVESVTFQSIILIQALSGFIQIIFRLESFVVIDNLIFRIGNVTCETISQFSNFIGDVRTELKTLIADFSLTELRYTDTNHSGNNRCSIHQDIRTLLIKIIHR